jgi:membrane protein implicated in regulation of membrane protease activity
MKSIRLFFVLIAILFLSFVFVGAQLADLGEKIEDVSENLENNISKVKEFTEGDKWDFIGSQWKEFLLKNKSIAGTNAFFTKINPLFLFLFARDWSLSVGMFFALLLWFFTLFSAYWLISACGLKKWQSWLLSLGAVLFLAHTTIFNSISTIFEKLILYKVSYWWKISIFVLVVFSIHAYLFINKFLSKRIKLSQEMKKKKEEEQEVEREKKFRERVQKALNQTERLKEF